MAQIESLSGKSFDPRVVEVLKRRYRELDRMAQAQPREKPRLSKDLKIGRGLAPAAGLEVSHADKSQPRYFLDSIAAARQEVRLLFELTRELGSSLSVDETLSVVGVRLKRMIPYDAIAVYILRDGFLVPEYVHGEDFRLFSSLRIPIGQGPSGWVAEKEKPILNGNPSVECGYLKDPEKFSVLRSALAVPLEGLNGTVGVLTLYRSEKDAFSRDNLRILLAISSKVSLSIENALKFRQAEDSATTDYLTNLPNSRSLFPRLEHELARCKREHGTLCTEMALAPLKRHPTTTAARPIITSARTNHDLLPFATGGRSMRKRSSVALSELIGGGEKGVVLRLRPPRICGAYLLESPASGCAGSGIHW